MYKQCNFKVRDNNYKSLIKHRIYTTIIETLDIFITAMNFQES